MHNNANLVWPPSPYKPKIQYIRSITSSLDLEIKKSWLQKTVDSLFGREQPSDIMLRPYGVCVRDERIYVTDPGLFMIHVFDLQEREYFQIDSIQNNQPIAPLGITIDTNGEIYFSDSVLKKVIVLDKKGQYKRDIGSPQSFVRPTGLSVKEDRVYVVDTLAHQVLVFSKREGTLLFRIGKNGHGNGEFHYPTHIFMAQNGLIYVTDSLNFRVQTFDYDGKFIASLGQPGDMPGNLSKPKGIAVDSENHVYVVDSQFNNVQIFNTDGTLLLLFGSSGTGKGKMSIPAGIFIDEKDRIYVADSYNRRIQIFQYIRDENGFE
jgi:sugar lactone lactonase YvrE